ncbi:hypothetical protein H490_0102915 [Leucobacter sp. UCD-THU]|uniref:DUF3237 domain-containing protein n=1 Tax=Leucobacter sp. UCD-THU TaxID=1292023 RepID=UPI00037461BF|nr:DUF3237 domain-containing protein [Leucobacter sp. UCD-THU]EYT56118.1 hypothetical protein H490_0102915 [Leucobacter sp. UCD-THU]
MTAATATAPAAARAPGELPAPTLEYVFEIRATVDPDLRIGRGADELLTFTPISGGSVTGPRLNGEVLAGGGDWAVERSGTAQLEARYLIRADDGAVIDVLNRGYFRATDEVMARMERGEAVLESDPGLYFRTAPVFQTDAPAHRWLAEHQFIGLARDGEGGAGEPQVCIRVFAVR